MIVDDEPLALDVLRSCLEEYPDIDIVAACRNGREAIAATLTHQPDLMFLDIHMPGKNGFEVIKALQNDVMPMVVFVTTYQQYALDAFDLHAVDYIPKPLDEERLARAVKRAVVRHRAAGETGVNKPPLIGAIDELLGRLNTRETAASLNKLIIRDVGSARLIEQERIDWVDAAGDYMCIHAAGETHIMRSTVKELVASLDDRVFKRIHRSTIVNIEKVSQVESLSKGDYLVSLDCGERLKVSRSYNTAVKALMRPALSQTQA